MQAADGRDQASWLAQQPAVASLAYKSAFAPGTDLGEGRWFGNAVLTRGPIDSTKVIPLTAGEQPPEGRVVLHVKTAGVDVFCTHLNWQFHHGVVREDQVLELVDAVESLSTEGPVPPIVAGDFNAEPTSTEIRFLTGDASLDGRSTYFQDAWRVAGARGPGYTWDNRNLYAEKAKEPDRRIDYVFVGIRHQGGAGRVESCRVVCDRALTGTFASDHFGVLAEIATP